MVCSRKLQFDHGDGPGMGEVPVVVPRKICLDLAMCCWNPRPIPLFPSCLFALEAGCWNDWMVSAPHMPPQHLPSAWCMWLSLYMGHRQNTLCSLLWANGTMTSRLGSWGRDCHWVFTVTVPNTYRHSYGIAVTVLLLLGVDNAVLFTAFAYLSERLHQLRMETGPPVWSQRSIQPLSILKSLPRLSACLCY